MSQQHGIWGRTYNRYLAMGHDHGSAAYAADRAERNAAKRDGGAEQPSTSRPEEQQRSDP